jgi:hypothetical protein
LIISSQQANQRFSRPSLHFSALRPCCLTDLSLFTALRLQQPPNANQHSQAFTVAEQTRQRFYLRVLQQIQATFLAYYLYHLSRELLLIPPAAFSCYSGASASIYYSLTTNAHSITPPHFTSLVCSLLLPAYSHICSFSGTVKSIFDGLDSTRASFSKLLCAPLSLTSSLLPPPGSIQPEVQDRARTASRLADWPAAPHR